MPEIQVPETADVELGLEQTRDLKKQGLQIESLWNRANSLQTDINQRITNCEKNLRELHKRCDEEIHQLRLDYDVCIDRGDAVGSGKCLDKIRQVRKELRTLAQQVQKSEDDVSDLTARERELSGEVHPLIAMTTENLELAKKLDIRARQISGQLSGSVGMDLFKLSRVIEDGKKIAEEILSL